MKMCPVMYLHLVIISLNIISTFMFYHERRCLNLSLIARKKPVDDITLHFLNHGHVHTMNVLQWIANDSCAPCSCHCNIIFFSFKFYEYLNLSMVDNNSSLKVQFYRVISPYFTVRPQEKSQIIWHYWPTNKYKYLAEYTFYSDLLIKWTFFLRTY